MLPRSASISSSIRPGSNPCISTNVPRMANVPISQPTSPPMWNIGMALGQTPPSGNLARGAMLRDVLMTPRWCSHAPFGKPVVPEMQWIWTMSSGFILGSGRAGSAAFTSASTSDRSSGRRGRTSSTKARRFLAREASA